MANQDFYEIVDLIGSKPVQIAVGENPDGDTRYRIDVSYSFRGEERRRIWLTKTQLEAVHALIGAFLYGDQTGDNGTTPPF